MWMTPPNLKTYFLVQESCYNAVEDKGREKKKKVHNYFFYSVQWEEMESLA